MVTTWPKNFPGLGQVPRELLTILQVCQMDV